MGIANGQHWRILATEGVVSWVEKMASIMELEPREPNRYPKLIFARNCSGKERCRNLIGSMHRQIRKDLPRSGWKTRNLGLISVFSHSDVPDVIVEIGENEGNNLDILKMQLSLWPIYQQVQDAGGLPIHAGLVEWNGIGILLAAPGNGGKSTCCQRLLSPWHVLCDDETLIVCDNQKQYLTHPFPTWSDYFFHRAQPTWNVQRHVSLSAIFFLEQAEIDKAFPIGRAKAAILTNQLATQILRRGWRNLDQEEERRLKNKLFENACQLARTIPTFILRVSLTGQFWEEMEKVL